MDRPSLKLVNAAVGERAGDPGDDDLMLLVRAGRQDAFEVLVRRHQQLVLGLASRFLGSRSWGRDVAQDVFLSLWAERERYQARGRFRSYLVSVTLHRCHAVARKARSQARRVEMLQREKRTCGNEEDPPLRALVEAERARQVREKLVRLPGKMRLVMILRYFHDLSLEEISDETGMPLGTVKSHVFRGLKRLRLLLARDGS